MSNNSQKSVVVYTANFGAKDNLLDPKNLTKTTQNEVDFVCISDNKKAPNKVYKNIYVEPQFSDVAKNARRIKILGFKEIENYEIAIWHDSSIRLDSNAIQQLVEFAKSHTISTFKHGREDIYLEAIACIENNKDRPIRIAQQMQRYSSSGIKAHSGLFETGILVINTKRFMGSELQKIWWNEIEKCSRRDQLSLPFAAHTSNSKIGILEGSGHENPYSKYIGHQYEHYLDSGQHWFDKLNIVKKLAIRYIYKLRYNS